MGGEDALVSQKATATEPGQAWTLLETEKCVRDRLCEDEDQPPGPPGGVFEREARPDVGESGESSSSLFHAGVLGQGVRKLPLALRA